MAVFGYFNHVRSQADIKKFRSAFDYIEKLINRDSAEHLRLLEYPLGTFQKIELEDGCFALEQVYNTKERSECFFESHRKYIDLQFILLGTEIIGYADINLMPSHCLYDCGSDLIKYGCLKNAHFSDIVLKKHDMAIFYPEDVHMPCVKNMESVKVIKTVVKVRV